MYRVCVTAGGSAVLAALLVLVFAGGAACDQWFTDNFDGYASGNLAGQGGWSGSGAIKVQTSLVHGSSGKSIEADYLTNGSGDVSHVVDCGLGSQGQYIDFDAALDTAGSSPPGENLGYLKLFGTNGLEITRLYYAHQQFKVLTGQGQQVIVANAAARTWYHIRIGLDMNIGRISVWVNQNPVITNALVYNRSSKVGSIVFGQWGGLGTKFTKSKSYLDNLVCQSFPVPGATHALGPIWPWAGWEHSNVAYPYVLYDSATGVYTMYYSGGYAQEISDSVWDQWATGYATSTDGANWNRPVDDYEPILFARKMLEAYLLDPETESAVFDSIAAFGPCVIKDGSTYRMWYTGWNGDSVYDTAGITTRINYRIGYATSPDGLTWTKQPQATNAGAVLGVGQQNQPDFRAAGSPHVIKDGAVFRMWYEGFDGSTWCILYATSTNCVNWTRQGTAISPGPVGSLDALGARNPVVFQRDGGYELWYQGRSSAAPNYHVLRATSSDGVTWTKAVDEILLHPEYEVKDDERVFVDSVLVNPDGSCNAYFAKEITEYEAATYGTLRTRRFHIYREVVNP